MLVIDESAIYASWQMLLPEHPEWMSHCCEHITRWVRRDRNHPAVILWSAENEGLNVNALTPAMLAEFKRAIDLADGSRPVIFDGDGTVYGVSPASVKHYVSTIENLDKDYDAMGPFPKPPVLKAGDSVKRTLIVYNDAFSDEKVELRWSANLAGEKIAGETRALDIPLGGHTIVEISFTPAKSGELRLYLIASKGGKEVFNGFYDAFALSKWFTRLTTS